MSTTNSLQFGVEIELLVGSRKKSHSSWKSLANELSKRLTRVGISNHVNDKNDKSTEHYREWSIVQEVTIPSQPAKGLWGLELVSPVYPAAWYWATDIETIFSTLRSSFAVTPSANCSTHIHVSGSPCALSAMEVAALAKAALYFESALDALVPAGRRASTAYWCQSNRASPALAHLPSANDCVLSIDAAVAYSSEGAASGSFSSSPSSSSSREGPVLSGSETAEHAAPAAADAATLCAVIEAMNLFPASSPYGRAHSKKKDFVRGKVYKWDFTGMLPSASSVKPRGTVEFRQPPGSVTAEDAKGWVTLALAFVAGVVFTPVAVGMNGLVPRGDEASLEELWDVLLRGANALGWDGLGAAEGIFAGREA